MTALTGNINVDFSRAGKQRAHATANRASRQVRIIVQTVELIWSPLAIKQSLLIGQLAAVFAFFGWLEEKQQIVFWLMLTEPA